MGHPSDQRLSARRPGKNERMRVKKPFRGQIWSGYRDHATGDLISVHVRGGKKKLREFSHWLGSLRDEPSTRDAQTPRKPQPGSPVGPVSGTAGVGPAHHQ